MQPPFTEIVVPLDGSPTAERAMGPALDLSRRTGVPLRVLSRALPGEKEELTTYLAGVADRYAALADVETLVTGRDDVAAAIRAARNGEMYLDPAVAGVVARQLRTPGGSASPADDTVLTPRELDVLALVAQGLPNRAIGDALGMASREITRPISKLIAGGEVRKTLTLHRKAKNPDH